MCTLYWWGRGSQKVYGLYTHENVDIYGWPLSIRQRHTLKTASVSINDHDVHNLT